MLDAISTHIIFTYPYTPFHSHKKRHIVHIAVRSSEGYQSQIILHSHIRQSNTKPLKTPLRHSISNRHRESSVPPHFLLSLNYTFFDLFACSLKQPVTSSQSVYWQSRVSLPLEREPLDFFSIGKLARGTNYSMSKLSRGEECVVVARSWSHGVEERAACRKKLPQLETPIKV